MKKMLAALLAAVLTLCFAAALAEDTGLADVKAKGTLVMGFDEEYPPMGFVDENGEYVGFDIDLAKEVTDRLGVELVLQPISWDSKELELSGKNIDCIWSGLTMTPERIEKTEKMIEKWGPLAVFLGRFFPFIRTFMPFISGISGMRWSRFTPFSVLGGLCWSTLFTLLGYFFGGIPAVQKHFELVIIAILVLSLIPTIVGLLKAKFGKKKPAAEDTAETADAE